MGAWVKRRQDDAAAPSTSSTAAVAETSSGKSTTAAEQEAVGRLTSVEPGTLRGRPLRGALGFVTVSGVFGSVWATAIGGAPFSLFARDLGASAFQIGVLAALPFIASLVSMPASLLTERTGARKKIFLISLYAQRLLWLPIAVLPLWLFTAHGSHGPGSAAVLLFMGMILLMHAAGAMGGPAWLSWMADVVPERVRGKYFSRRRQWGIVSAIPAALVVGFVLDRMTPAGAAGAAASAATLQWCAIIFLCAAVFGVIDIDMFRHVPDVRLAPRRSVPIRHLLGRPLRDPQFLWFGGFVATLTFAVSFMGQFVTFYLIEKIGVSGTGIQLMLLVAPMLAQLIVLPIWGNAADRMGKRPVLAIASLGLVPVGLGWCFVGPGMHWLGYVLSVAGAALWTGVEVANLNFVLELSGSDKGENGGSAYVAMNSVIINVAGCLGGLSSGVIAKLLSHWHWDPGIAGIGSIGFYEVLFALSGVLRLAAAVVFLPMLIEPRAGGAVETIRFMSANIYNNLFNAILSPLRMLKVQEPARASRPGRAAAAAAAARASTGGEITEQPRPLRQAA
ncbi:MAG TPA: MFS transporter [Tepidisphaeraceae bacterium]|nr:MFS transporter [Tepidisphaeraceae bacterium]